MAIDTSFPNPFQIRGSLKSWTKLWCVLKPGLLLIYRSQKAKVCESSFFLTRKGASHLPKILSFIHKLRLQKENISS